MPKKKNAQSRAAAPAQKDDASLVGMAHNIGTTIGSAAAKAGGAAKEIGNIAQEVGRSALAATRKIYRRAQKTLRPGAAGHHAGAKKAKPAKHASGKNTKRGK